MTEPRVLRVSEFLAIVNETLRLIPSRDIVIEGEVSDYRVSQGKWVSFDLKDEEEEAVVKCFTTAWKVKVPVESGMRVRVTGYPKVYERFGTLKLNVETVELTGEGALARAYELLKQKLSDEGLFDPSRKRVLPRFPCRIGLITSREAAAYGDFLRILNNRWSGVEILHAHVHVQGKNAVPEITGAFQYFNRLAAEDRPDVLVLTRGGGGLEDLHAFNDEAVARAVYASSIPVVCAVGHERDESLADFVADVRASTPSNAAERIVLRREDVLYEIETMARRTEERLGETVADRRRLLESSARAMGMLVERERARLERLNETFRSRSDAWLPGVRERLETTGRLLKSVDPARVLRRGYSIVRAGKHVLADPSAIEIGTEITVELARGSLDAEVLRIGGKGKQKLI